MEKKMSFDEKLAKAKEWINKGYTNISKNREGFVLSNGVHTVLIDEEIYDYLVNEE
jgi:hypothetical protein